MEGQPEMPGDPGEKEAAHLLKGLKVQMCPGGPSSSSTSREGRPQHLAPKFSPPEAVIHSILGPGQQADEAPPQGSSAPRALSV